MNVPERRTVGVVASLLFMALLLPVNAAGARQVVPLPPITDSTSLAVASTAAVDSMSAQFLIEEGDALSERHFDNQGALAKYMDALTVEPDNSELFWRISRSHVDIAEHLPSVTENDRNYQLTTYERALNFANKAVAADPGGAMGYVRRAIATSRISMFKGVWEASDLVKLVRDDAQQAIKLDPRNSMAYYMLGRVHAKVSERPWIFRIVLGLGWADLDDAVPNYERAVSLRPDFITYRIAAAQAYFELGEYDKAKAHLLAIDTLPKLDEDDDKYRTEAKDLLEKIREEEE